MSKNAVAQTDIVLLLGTGSSLLSLFPIVFALISPRHGELVKMKNSIVQRSLQVEAIDITWSGIPDNLSARL